MDQFQEGLYIGAMYVGFGLCLGLVADYLLFAYFPKIKEKLFSTRELSVPWLIQDVLIIFLFYFGLQFGFGLIGLLLKQLKLISDPFLHYLSLFWATVGVNTLILIFLLAYFQKKYRVDWENLGFYKKKLKSYIGLGLLCYLGFIPLFFMLVILSVIICTMLGIEPKPHVLVNIFKEETSWFVLGGLAIFASIIGPVVEEILFRGVLYPVVRKKWGMRIALISTSLFFALIHFNSFQFLPIFGLGLVLAFLYEKTGNLLPSITLHALNNTVSLILTFIMLKSSS